MNEIIYLLRIQFQKVRLPFFNGRVKIIIIIIGKARITDMEQVICIYLHNAQVTNDAVKRSRI